MADEKTATIEHLVTDMGNGAAFCSACDYNLNGGNPTKVLPSSCPKCGAKFTSHSTYVNQGGSDY